MGSVDFDDLSDELQEMVVKLQIELDELKYEANFYRAATLVVLIIVAERLWERFF